MTAPAGSPVAAATQIDRGLALVVDDSRAMRKILSRILVEEGYQVVEAGDGVEALERLEDGPLPAVALVDWNMPRMDGLALIGAVRDRKEWRGITLVMVTTESEHNQIVRALAAGAHEYVLKPFTSEGLLDKLHMLGLRP